MDSIRAIETVLAKSYRLEKEVGRGATATVYLGVDRKHDRKVAVKVADGTVANAVDAERFMREVRFVSRLQHPNILPLLDSGSAGDVLYYVMPYVEGGTLAQRIRSEGPLSVEAALDIVRQVGEALAYAHDHGIIHRDVKPGNILLDGDRALLADFGIGRALADSPGDPLTSGGIAVGTPAYMSPEQASGEARIDARTDVYSLGCVLYETLVGEPPYTGATPRAILARSLTDRPRPISSVRRVPEELESAVMRALESTPADRFPSMRAFLHSLSVITEERRAKGWSTWQRPSPRKPIALRVVGAGIAAVAAVSVGLFALRSPIRGPPAMAGAGPIAVLPFTLTGDEQLGHLEQGVANLLATVLDGVGGLRTVDPAAVMGIVSQEAQSLGAPETVRAIVRRLGATRYVTGTVQELGGRITITAALNDLGAAPPELDRWAVDGDPNTEVLGMVNRLSVSLLAGLGVVGTPPDLESVTTESAVALNEFLRAEAAFGRGSYQAAAEALQRAVEVDSLFALAWFRLSYARMFTEGSSGVVAPAQRAWSLADRLSERDRRLTEALLAMNLAQAREADGLYRGILADYPYDVEALFGLADIRLHLGPLHGWPMGSLGTEFDRVLSLDANHSEALLHRPWAAALVGDTAAIRPAVERLVDLDPQGYFAPVFQTMLGVLEGDTAAVSAASGGLADDIAGLLAVTMTSTLQNLEATEQLAALVFGHPGVLPEVRTFGHLVRAHQFVGLGRWRDAMDQWAEAESLDAAAALEDRALLMLAPFAPVDRSALSELLRELEAWDPDGVPASLSGNPWIVPHDGLHSAFRLYLLGAVHARLGEYVSARPYADELAESSGSSAAPLIRNTLARNLRATIAFREGRSRDGLLELERPGLIGAQARTWERAYSSPFFSESLERFLSGQAYAETGNDQLAHDLFSSIWMSNALDLAYLAPSHLARAELYDRAGDREQALTHYRRFVELWGDSDDELRDRTQLAQDRIAVLERVSVAGR